jgi:hypothetical protein
MLNKTKISSLVFVVLLLSSIAVMFPIASADPDETYVSVINPADGTTYFNYTNVEPPLTDTGYPLGYFIANFTVTDVTDLAGYQVNLTWDPSLLKIASSSDVYPPSGHIFEGLNPMWMPPSIDNVVGYLGAVCSRGFGAATFTGSGTMFQVKFNVTKVPGMGETLSCDLAFGLAGTFPTVLKDSAQAPISFTPEDGYYEYMGGVLPKPYLEVSPSSVDLGIPMGPSIIGTPKEEFEIAIMINELPEEMELAAWNAKLYYNATLLKVIPNLATGWNATEGPFLNQTWETDRPNSWAPNGTVFFTLGEPGEIGIVGAIMSDVGVFPSIHPTTDGLTDEQRVLCTIKFKAILQEEHPWEAGCPLDLDMPVGGYFMNATHGWIPAKSPIDGSYHITGWILGRMVDVYTQLGGQGLNMTSDMFEPQNTVILRAILTYNADPVQNKLVTYQIVSPTGYWNFTRTATTDETGVARVDFGLPWPCEDAEELLFGEWTVVAKADIMGETTEDWLLFKVNYYVMDLTVTPKATEFVKDTEAEFTVTFCTYKQQPISVLLTIIVYDALNVPIGSASMWITVGDEDLKYCSQLCYEYSFSVPLPKWAFVGVGTAYVNALTDWPFACGRAYCPEESATFSILAYT